MTTVFDFSVSAGAGSSESLTPNFVPVPDKLLKREDRLPCTQNGSSADVVPSFAEPSISDLFEIKLVRRKSDQASAVCVAVPTSLSIDDVSVKFSLVNFRKPKAARSPRQTLVDTPSVVDGNMLTRRLAQLDQVMTELEATPDFWNKADLLLQDSWLNGYRGTFLEQQDLALAADSYKRALKLYALALKLDRLTSKSSPHIISFYYLLKRYSNVLTDPRLPKELADYKTVGQLQEQMEIIKKDRQRWGMGNPEKEDEPFAYPATILKVLCV